MQALDDFNMPRVDFYNWFRRSNGKIALKPCCPQLLNLSKDQHQHQKLIILFFQIRRSTNPVNELRGPQPVYTI